MVEVIAGGVIAFIFIALAGALHERRRLVTALRASVTEAVVRAERAERAERDLRAGIEHYASRPVLINITDEQIYNMADRIAVSITRLPQLPPARLQ